jgi:hypothetical protein
MVGADEFLEKIDAATGDSILPSVGVFGPGLVIWGLAAADGYVYGFTSSGMVDRIDPATGVRSAVPIAFAPGELVFVGAASAGPGG